MGNDVDKKKMKKMKKMRKMKKKKDGEGRLRRKQNQLQPVWEGNRRRGGGGRVEISLDMLSI